MPSDPDPSLPPTKNAAPDSPRALAGGDLKGKTALVTGASGGIGREIARKLAENGANVMLHAGRNRQAIEVLADELSQWGTRPATLVADLSHPVQRETLIISAFAIRESIDIWINNAGADVLTGPLANQSFSAKLTALWEVDVMGTIFLARAAGKRMLENKGGVIINMGWDQAETGQGGDSGEFFAATKGAIMAFSKSLAKSLAPSVRVNCLAPGWIQTAWGETTGPYWNRRAQGESLMNRWGTPEDVANAALFLASPQSSFINGQILRINGGAQPWPVAWNKPPVTVDSGVTTHTAPNNGPDAKNSGADD